MTKSEINEKANSYKIQLNDCEQHIDRYHHSIDLFDKFKNYLENSNEKAKKRQKLALTYTCGFAFFALASIFLSLPVSLILLVPAIISIERLIFFSKVTKKFEHCINFLSKAISNLTKKQSEYLSQKEYALEEIIKLEKAIPDVITYLENEAYLNDSTNSILENDLEVLGL